MAREIGTSARLRFGLARRQDLETPLAWYENELASDWSWSELREQAELGLVIEVTAKGTDDRVGLAALAPRSPIPSAASVTFLTIDPRWRFHGLGAEAGLFLEGHLREKLAAQAVFAPVPERRGLAVYFWLRLGFRPLLAASEGRATPAQHTWPGGIYMVRDAFQEP